MIPGLSTAKLIGLGVGLLGALAFVLLAFHWKAQAADRGAELAAVCHATRLAADNPKLDCKQVAVQVGLLGQAVSTLKRSIGSQNGAVTSLGDTSKRQQADSAKASQAAAPRARQAEATSTRLVASSRAGEAQAKPCEPSKALKGAWQ